MTHSSDGSQPSPAMTQPTAGQLLTGVAQLIMNAATMADITPDSVRQQLGLELTRDGREHATDAQLNPDWHYELAIDPQSIGGPQFYFGFFPTDPDAEATMTSICEVDLEQFAALLEGSGFDRTPWVGEHGRRMGQYFQRGALRVTVSTQGEASTPPEKINHACIRGIQVH